VTDVSHVTAKIKISPVTLLPCTGYPEPRVSCTVREYILHNYKIEM